MLKELQLNGSVTLKEAMDKLLISPATARRLFACMEEKGLGIRSHGKISLPDSSFSFYRYETSEELYVKEKKNDRARSRKTGTGRGYNFFRFRHDRLFVQYGT